MPTDRPLLAVTMGDPAGTGPELICQALASGEIAKRCRIVVYGDPQVMEAAARIAGCRIDWQVVEEDSALPVWDGPGTALRPLPCRGLENLKRATVSAEAGRAAYDAIVAAVRAAQAGAVDAVVTSAINKAALHAAGLAYPGHTELLAELCGKPEVTMMLVADSLRICHVSTHVALREAIERVRPARIEKVIELAHDGVRALGVAEPKIAVAGLNPHAGEGGLFGSEEEERILPAIERARARGWSVAGPFPGDTIFFRTLQGEFDVAIAMYHDQGHVAAKMLGIWRGVNVTLGLPILRTSVEHGTDFAHAGTGQGDPRSLLEAIRLAAAMALRRRPPSS
jgi:4-hydroxythreonine-4-phosphate dehydrogenase